MKNLITKRKGILRKIVGKVRKGFDKGKKYGLAGLVGLGMLAYTNNANALSPGERGYADSTNWWNLIYADYPEEPNTGGKALNLTTVIFDPLQNYTNKNSLIGLFAKCPDGTNQLLNVWRSDDTHFLEGDYGHQTNVFSYHVPGWIEGTNVELFARLHLDGFNFDQNIKKDEVNGDDWKITWEWTGPPEMEYRVTPDSATIRGTVIPEPVGIYVAGLWGLYALRRKKE